MALPLKEGTHIYVERKAVDAAYVMPAMEMATDHYSLSYIISGDRATITPSGTFSYHAGMVTGSPPFRYARTVSKSDVPYERILIKFSPEIVTPFIEKVGQQIFDGIYEQVFFSFSEDSRVKIEKMFFDMLYEYEKETPYREFILQGMLFRLLLVIWEERIPEEGVNTAKTTLTPPIVEAISYIEKSYYQNPSLEETANVAGFSPAYFSRLFHTQMGKSYSEYLSSVKLHHASILLVQTDKSIMEIAQETGFCHGNYLNELFKKKMGMTPGQFRKRKK
ncbi:MAG: helix-turn-helix transcriptional regulator [Lachnospiraceae bacterium]|nr:helix-turn-helix transcriptional regulator [Lachnospiraceae bacterium]